MLKNNKTLGLEVHDIEIMSLLFDFLQSKKIQYKKGGVPEALDLAINAIEKTQKRLNQIYNTVELFENRGYLTMESVLVCRKGGVVSFLTSGQYDKSKLKFLDEKVVIVVRDRSLDWRICTYSQGDAHRKLGNAGIDNLIETHILKQADSLEKYKICQYNFMDSGDSNSSKGCGEIYFKFALMKLDGSEFSTIRYLDEEYQETVRRADTKDGGNYIEGTRLQEEMEEKVEAVAARAAIAVKLCYMIKDGPNALAQYRADKHAADAIYEEYRFNPDFMNQYLIDYNNAKLASKMRATNYGQAIINSCYGMWGKWYSLSLGWHRGIDVCPGGKVYAIYSGEVIDTAVNNRTSIFSEDLGVTVTYMHLSRVDPFPEFVQTGDLLGEQSNIGTVGAHTHVEFNMGRYVKDTTEWENGQGDICPWSQYDKRKPKLSEITPGINFSNNPYYYIDKIWRSRGGTV